MTCTVELLKYYRKRREAIQAELTTAETPELLNLRDALEAFFGRWQHAEALLRNPFHLLERGPEVHQAFQAGDDVLGAMLFAQSAVATQGAMDASQGLYNLPSQDEEDNQRFSFLYDFMEKEVEKWVAAYPLEPASSLKVKWGLIDGKGALMLELVRAKVFAECTVQESMPARFRTLGDDLASIRRHKERLFEYAERELKYAWPSDKDIAARQATDAIMARATLEELETLVGQKDFLSNAPWHELQRRKRTDA